MTAVLDVADDDTTSARPATTPREAWRKARLPVLVGAVFAVVALVEVLVTGTVKSGLLDPAAAEPEGGRALAALLRDHGVDVRTVDAPTGGADTTVFVPVPELVDAFRPGAVQSAAGAPEVVIASPGEEDLADLAVDVTPARGVDVRTVDPACDQPDAVAAGSVRLGGIGFGAPGDAVTCYAVGGYASFVEVVRDGRRLTVLGTGSFMTNERLDDAGNAALALRLLSRHPTLEWVYPHSGVAPEDEQQSLTSLLPHRLYVGLAELLVATLLLALWRARRLGPVVVEPLPVVVRAAEAVEGRARLYQSAAARGRAADALRAGLRDRLVRALGLAADASRETLVAAATTRTARTAADVTELLYGRPPSDDAALVRLATDLDQLDSEVRAL